MPQTDMFAIYKKSLLKLTISQQHLSLYKLTIEIVFKNLNCTRVNIHNLKYDTKVYLIYS